MEENENHLFDDVYEKSILLIGGMAVGKSTISELLARKLDMSAISIDAKKDELLQSLPEYSFEEQLKIRSEYGFSAEARYLLPYLNLTLNSILGSLRTPAIIDLGALSTMGLDITSITKLGKYKNIILLKTDDLDSILKRREVASNSDLGQIYLETHRNPNNEHLCTQVINVDNKSPEEIVEEILELNCEIKKK